MTRSSDFVLEIRLKSVKGLVDDRILVYPTKDSNILLKLGEVCRSGSSLAEVLELLSSGTLFVGVTIISLEILNKQSVIIEEVWSSVMMVT